MSRISLAFAFTSALAALNACAPPGETDRDEVPNPTTCEATNSGITLKCVGTGVDGALYTCDCTRPNLDSCAIDSDCDSIDGERCIDGACNEVAIFTDLEICIDGVSANEVLDRCSGLPPAP